MSEDQQPEGQQPLAPGSRAPDLEVQFSDGGGTRLSQLWSERPLLLALTRHLGCAFCRQQLGMLRDHHQQLESRGIQVVGVTMRDAEETERLRTELKLPFRCIADPQREVYQAYEAPRGSWAQVLGPQVWGAAVGALARGGMGVPKGDLRQLHASFLIDTEGRVVLAHYPRNSADQLSCEAVLETAPDG